MKKLDLSNTVVGSGGVVLKRTKSLELSESSSTTSESPLPGLGGVGGFRSKGSEHNSSYEMSTAFRGDVST